MTYKEAFDLFKEKFPLTKASEIFDCGECFCISDAIGGDMIDAEYSINKKTGEIKELSFLEFIDMIKSNSEKEIITYKV